MEPRHLEFFVLSYAPSLSGEMNIGVVGFERQDNQVTFADARFITRVDAILEFDSSADIELIDALFREIRASCRDAQKVEEFVRIAIETFSNTIQISNQKDSTFSTEPTTELDRLAAVYLSSDASDSLSQKENGDS